MKRIYSTAIVALVAASLAGCATNREEIDAKIKEVQDATKLACSFVPTVDTVAQIITAFTGGAEAVGLVGAAARGICNAVTTAPLADGPGDRIPRYRGVVINGHYIK